MDHEWIGITEAKKILGKSPNTIKKLVEKGILPGYEVTGVQGIQFKREDVEKLIKRIEPKSQQSKRKRKTA